MIIRAYYVFSCQSDKALYRKFILTKEQLSSIRTRDHQHIIRAQNTWNYRSVFYISIYGIHQNSIQNFHWHRTKSFHTRNLSPSSYKTFTYSSIVHDNTANRHFWLEFFLTISFTSKKIFLHNEWHHSRLHVKLITIKRILFKYYYDVNHIDAC